MGLGGWLWVLLVVRLGFECVVCSRRLSGRIVEALLVRLLDSFLHSLLCYGCHVLSASSTHVSRGDTGSACNVV
jgi:hypothetical protein